MTMTHGSVAQSARLAKANDPAAWCPHPGCLWRTGGGYCDRHRPEHGLVPVERVEAIAAYGMAAARDSLGRRPPRRRFKARLGLQLPGLGVGADSTPIMETHYAYDASTDTMEALG